MRPGLVAFTALLNNWGVEYKMTQGRDEKTGTDLRIVRIEGGDNGKAYGSLGVSVEFSFGPDGGFQFICLEDHA